MLDRFVLTRGAATDLLNAERARHAFAHYFHTGSELLDLRNALRYYRKRHPEAVLTIRV